MTDRSVYEGMKNRVNGQERPDYTLAIDRCRQRTIRPVVSGQQEDASNCRLRLTLVLPSVDSLFEDPLITTSHRVKLIKRIASFRARRLQIVGSEISMEKWASANSYLFLCTKCNDVVRAN